MKEFRVQYVWNSGTTWEQCELEKIVKANSVDEARKIVEDMAGFPDYNSVRCVRELKL